jgi:16S rRNA U516 pseudouridylate synthase RsuA-like enzyme
MFEATGHPVMKIRRTRIGFLSDAGLPTGSYRHLTPGEVARILKAGAQRGARD